MANTLSLQKSMTGLLTLAFTFVAVAPGGFMLNAPRASAFTTYTVTNTADAGAGSLRQAITDANANANVGGNDVINITTNGTLNLASDLPDITESVTIDGSTQNPAFIIAGAGRTNGLNITGGSGTLIRGITIQQPTNCIRIANPANNTVIGDTVNGGAVVLNNCSGAGIYNNGAIGTTVKATYIGSNGGNGTGIKIDNTTSNMLIGGTTASERNVIQSSTSHGISIINSDHVTIKGNYIGLDKNGAPAGNAGTGISVQTGCSAITIGGTTVGERNIISSNTQQGIDINSDNTLVQGNYIGTDPNAASAKANGQAGVKVQANSVTIGGDNANQGNIISGNAGAGIRVDGSTRNVSNLTVRNNYIGVAANGSVAIPNAAGFNIAGGTISNVTIGGSNGGNVISGNTGLGIAHQTATNTNIGANYIGVGADGQTPVGNSGGGVYLQSGTATLGAVGCSTCINLIDANSGFGLKIESNNNQIYNNRFGYTKNGDFVSNLANTGGPAILIQSTASGNVISGASAGSGNNINIPDGQYGIISNGANFNNFRGNSYFHNGPAYLGFAQRQNASNENVATPVLTSVLRTSPTNVAVSGTALANSNVDIHIMGTLMGTLISDGSGNFSGNITNSGGTDISAFVTTAGGSTSGSAAITSIPIDNTASPVPTINYDAQGYAGVAANIYGYGATIGDTVVSNGAKQAIKVGADGTFTYSPTLVEGTNSFVITIVDDMGNTSGSVTANIFAIANSVGSGNSGGGGSFSASPSSSSSDSHSTNPTTTTTEQPIDTSNVGQTPSSMAGDTEVVTTVTTEPTTTNTQTTTPVLEPTSSTTTQTPVVKNPTPNTKPVTNVKPKTFYSGVYEYVKPIKPVSIRDTMPTKPARTNVYTNNLLQAQPFKGKTIGGFPAQLVSIKLNTANPTTTDLTADNDNDGLLNGEEILAGSNPNSKDGDGDGTSDFQEVEFNGTNPSSWDSDHDLIPDNKDAEPLVYNDPIESVSAKTETAYIAEHQITESLGVTDSDEDGLCDELELAIGTDPQDSDSDADGLTDGDEVMHIGTDPSNPTAEGTGGVLRLTDTSEEETVAEGEQFFMGSADANSTVGIYELASDGTMSLLGQTESDESGRFTVYTDDSMEAGTHTLVAIQGTEDNIEDITGTYTLKVLSWVKRPEYVSLAIKNGSKITDTQPVIDLLASAHTMVVISWRSTVYSQVLIADADNQVVYAKPAESLGLGDHTVTWYAQDLSTNNKSNPTRVAFNITNEAFVSGQTDGSNSPWTLILGSIAVLASLSALGLYFRRKSVPSRQ